MSPAQSYRTPLAREDQWRCLPACKRASSVTSKTSIMLKVGLEENGGHDDVISEAFEGLNNMRNMPQLSDSPKRPSG